MKRLPASFDELFEVPWIDGVGSIYDLSSTSTGKVYGQKGARIRVRLKPAPMGFRPPVKR